MSVAECPRTRSPAVSVAEEADGDHIALAGSESAESHSAEQVGDCHYGRYPSLAAAMAALPARAALYWPIHAELGVNSLRLIVLPLRIRRPA